MTEVVEKVPEDVNKEPQKIKNMTVVTEKLLDVVKEPQDTKNSTEVEKKMPQDLVKEPQKIKKMSKRLKKVQLNVLKQPQEDDAAAEVLHKFKVKEPQEHKNITETAKEMPKNVTTELQAVIDNDSQNEPIEISELPELNQLTTVEVCRENGDEDNTQTETSPRTKRLKRKQVTTNEISSKKRAYQKYRKDWENVPSYRPWLSESILGNMYFYCKFCKNDNKCGRSEIEKHMVSKKHIKNSKISKNRKQRRFAFQGLLCPVFTPFSIKEQEINYNVIPDYANYLCMCGVRGVLINDLIGEGTSLTLSERMKMTEVWQSVCERNNQHLMVQVGGANIKAVQDLVLHASRKKVGSIVVLPDVINKPKDHLELMCYIKLVADCATELPILYHHNPSVTGVNINMQKLLNDILGEIDNFVGIIFNDNNLHDAVSALHVKEDKFTVFMATDEIILGAYASGFTSFVAPSLNYLPKLLQTICEAAKVGNLKDANHAQRYLRNVLEAIYRYGDTLPALKAAMNLLVPFNVGVVRYPLVSIWQDKILKMKGDLQTLQVGVLES